MKTILKGPNYCAFIHVNIANGALLTQCPTSLFCALILLSTFNKKTSDSPEYLLSSVCTMKLCVTFVVFQCLLIYQPTFGCKFFHTIFIIFSLFYLQIHDATMLQKFSKCEVMPLKFFMNQNIKKCNFDSFTDFTL